MFESLTLSIILYVVASVIPPDTTRGMLGEGYNIIIRGNWGTRVYYNARKHLLKVYQISEGKSEAKEASMMSGRLRHHLPAKEPGHLWA